MNNLKIGQQQQQKNHITNNNNNEDDNIESKSSSSSSTSSSSSSTTIPISPLKSRKRCYNNLSHYHHHHHHHHHCINHSNCTNHSNHSNCNKSHSNHFHHSTHHYHYQQHQQQQQQQHGKKRRKLFSNSNDSNSNIVSAKHLLFGGINFNDPLNLKNVKDDEANNNNDDGNIGDDPVIIENEKQQNQDQTFSNNNSKETINVLIPKNLKDPLNLQTTTNQHQHHHHNCNNYKKRQRTSSESEIHRSLPASSTSSTSLIINQIKDDSCLNNCYEFKIENSKKLPITTTTTTTSKQKFKKNQKFFTTNNKEKQKERFQYGNYNRYYGYRNINHNDYDHNTDNNDIRIELFQKEWFENKLVLDIGCNIGNITMIIAEKFRPKNILGIDIDENLIKLAKKYLRKEIMKKIFQIENYPKLLPQLYGSIDLLLTDDDNSLNYPNNIQFININYVPETDEQLDNQLMQYDCILLLSVTKWIHLNWCDIGLKRTFHRIYKQLHNNGVLILEPQPWSSYKKSKMTQKLLENFRTLRFKPEHFHEFLLKDVGFKTCELLGTPKHNQKGFQRPIYLYTKKI